MKKILSLVLVVIASACTDNIGYRVSGDVARDGTRTKVKANKNKNKIYLMICGAKAAISMKIFSSDTNAKSQPIEIPSEEFDILNQQDNQFLVSQKKISHKENDNTYSIMFNLIPSVVNGTDISDDIVIFQGVISSDLSQKNGQVRITEILNKKVKLTLPSSSCMSYINTSE